ncbi:hypothetical protein, partial [Peribacillus frigoritolerans]|uniref:hypothetical protein n=1 Tax=Peribacillus frigoritolerans TaxID=450367 RepID=UPI002417C35B
AEKRINRKHHTNYLGEIIYLLFNIPLMTKDSLVFTYSGHGPNKKTPLFIGGVLSLIFDLEGPLQASYRF